MADIPLFQGNDIYRSSGTGSPVLPANAIADRLRAGNFGPAPNDTAPPGYQIAPSIDPKMVAMALRSRILPNIAGGQPPAPAPTPPPAPPAPAFIPPWFGTPGFGPGGDVGYGAGGAGGYGPGVGAGLGMGAAAGGAFGGMSGYGDAW